MPYKVPQSLPWDEFITLWDEAGDALARLDQCLGHSDLREAWLRRADFEEAAAALWVEGGLVPLEDLVLDDAHTNARLPNHELFQARSILLIRRRLARQKPDEVLTIENLLALQEGRDQLDTTRQDTQEMLLRDPFWDPEEALEEWLALLPQLAVFPSLPATAIALHAWDKLCPFQHRNATMGRLLASSLFMKQGKITGQILCLNVGLKAIRWYDHATWHSQAAAPLEIWIKEFCRAVTKAAGQGLQLHQQLVMARRLMARRLEGRRTTSHLPAVAQLVLEQPLVSAPMIAKKLGTTQPTAVRLMGELVGTGAVRELTGRSRFRAYGIV
ncbi:DUF1612 domain-containing protein [Pelagibius sp. Alg239-R121]|uniref:DUF1612 domain-containing protein n=1 Tax=Pelagibius sp. Alg239-R121 TaxID=2993448 RepID=UPI0024A71A9B|nr:DUF1612 domain-containing protein [Pelagibius sp. Alg239-R121]